MKRNATGGFGRWIEKRKTKIDTELLTCEKTLLDISTFNLNPSYSKTMAAYEQEREKAISYYSSLFDCRELLSEKQTLYPFLSSTPNDTLSMHHSVHYMTPFQELSKPEDERTAKMLAELKMADVQTELDDYVGRLLQKVEMGQSVRVCPLLQVVDLL